MNAPVPVSPFVPADDPAADRAASPAAGPTAGPARQRKWPRVLALLVVAVALLGLVAATFVLSYDGLRAVALEAGVSASLARFYPGVLDAALVIACAAALLLRDGRWWARCYAWLAVILIMAVAGGTDAVHAMNVVLPRRQTEGVVAAAPWVLVLLAFSLWITILRQSGNVADGPVAEAGVAEAGVAEAGVAEAGVADASPDYRDTGEQAGYTSPASPGLPAEVHHSVDEPGTQAPTSPLAPPTLLRRVRSTPIPPEEGEDDTT